MPKGQWWNTAKAENKGCIAKNAEVREIHRELPSALGRLSQTVDKRSVAPLTVTEKARELAADNIVPSKGNKDATFFTDGVPKGQWWRHAKAEKRGCIETNAEVREIIENCPVLWGDYQNRLTNAPCTAYRHGKGA